MKKDQEFTPKYWVAHRKSTDDVFLKTADKCRMVVEDSLAGFLGPLWMDEEDFGVILIEIKIVVGE